MGGIQGIVGVAMKFLCTSVLVMQPCLPKEKGLHKIVFQIRGVEV